MRCAGTADGGALSQDPRSFGFPTFCPGDDGLCVSSGLGAFDPQGHLYTCPVGGKNWKTDHEEKRKTGAERQNPRSFLWQRSWATSVDRGQECLRRPQDHHGIARPPDPSLRDHRNRATRAGASRTAPDTTPAVPAARLPRWVAGNSHTASLHMSQGINEAARVPY